MNRIQEEINRVYASGGGVAEIPPGRYRCGTITLRSNVEVHLAPGAEIIGSCEISDYPEPQTVFLDGVAQKRGRALILADRVENAALTGEGIIDGSGAEFPTSHPDFNVRPFLVRVIGCRNFRMEGIRLQNGAAWNCVIQRSEKVVIRNVVLESLCNANNDGIDVDGSSHVCISGCRIHTGDDAICLKNTFPEPGHDILIEDCTLNSLAAAIKFGTESYGDLRDVTIRHCRIEGGVMGALKILTVDGGRFEHIRISDLEIVRACHFGLFRIGERRRTYAPGVPEKAAGALRDVVIEQVRGTIVPRECGILTALDKPPLPVGAHTAVTLMGDIGAKISGVTFRDVDLTLPGSSGSFALPEAVPENRSGYPEIGYFGVIPASALYLRHAENVFFERFRIRTAAPDFRPAVVTEDTENLTMDNVTLPEEN